MIIAESSKDVNPGGVETPVLESRLIPDNKLG